MHFSSKSVGRVIVAAAASLSLLALAGCSSTPGGSSAEPETRTLTIATSNDAPFSYTDTSGTLLGIDGEMITAIAEEKGWEIEVFTTDFNTLISALKANKADVIVDAMYITDERKKQVDFTEPWYTEGEGMLVPADSTITSRDELGGKVIGAQTGTVFADFVATLGGSETKYFDSQAAIITAVANKQVDAAFTDSAVLAYGLVENPNDKVKIVDPYDPHFPGIIGAAVKKDDADLLKELNAGLAELKKSPKYLEILQKYGLGEANTVE